MFGEYGVFLQVVSNGDDDYPFTALRDTIVHRIEDLHLYTIPPMRQAIEECLCIATHLSCDQTRDILHHCDLWGNLQDKILVGPNEVVT